jgi:hypothetical protein
VSNETTALQKIENAQKTGALIFIDQGSLVEHTPLYKLDVTEMVINKTEDCFSISGKYMPKREIVDRIGDACGVTFILGETKAVPFEDPIGKRVVYTAFSQGQKMLPDGTYRQSSICTYDFDYVLRAMLDFDVTELNEQTKQKYRRNQSGKEYGSPLARYILELQKVASQRANTGARLRVIRELAGMPEAFAEKDIQKPLYFGRMIQNTDYILKTPEGRAMATAKALGVDMATLFGSRKPSLTASTGPAETTIPAGTSEPERETEPEGGGAADNMSAHTTAADEPDFPTDNEGQARQEQETEFARLTNVLEEYLTYKDYLNVTTKSGTNPYELAQDELNSTTATEDTRVKMINRIRDFLIAKKVKGVA